MHRSVGCTASAFDAEISVFDIEIAAREHEMKESQKIVHDEKGYMAILASLMILALLTILGVAASKSANTEVMMTGNEIRYQRNFYRAEGAAMEAADILQHASNLADALPDWIEPVADELTIENFNDYWDNSSAEGNTVIPRPSTIDPNHTLFIAGKQKGDSGHSLDSSKPTIHSLEIYGRCEWDGVTTIKLGYLVAY
jgi:hypothetical protein